MRFLRRAASFSNWPSAGHSVSALESTGRPASVVLLRAGRRRYARRPIRPVFGLERWGENPVVGREWGRAANFCLVQKLGPGSDHIHLQILVDQKQGQVIVLSTGGHEFGRLDVPEEKTPPIASQT